MFLFSKWSYNAILFRLVLKNKSACFRAEHRGDCLIEALTAAIFSEVLAVRGRSVDFRFKADPLYPKVVTHNKTAFRIGTG